MNNYEILAVIGEGAYGVVLRGRHRPSGQEVAIKRFKEMDQDQLLKKTIERETYVLRSMCHENIVQLRQAFRHQGIVSLVFELLDNNLLQVLQSQRQGLQIEQVRKFIGQLLEGLRYMHNKNYIHRDVKPENLLIRAGQHLKICDMGFARCKNNEGLPLTDYVATRWYRAPELLVGAPYAEPIDIWATGCIMAELVDGKPLFPGNNELNQLYLIKLQRGKLPNSLKAYQVANNIKCNPKNTKKNYTQFLRQKYHGKITEEGIDLIKQMLHTDQSKRITAEEALRHPFFQNKKHSIIHAQINQTYRKQEHSLEYIAPKKIGQKHKNDCKIIELNKKSLDKVRKLLTNNSNIEELDDLTNRKPMKQLVHYSRHNKKSQIKKKTGNSQKKLSFMTRNKNNENSVDVIRKSKVIQQCITTRKFIAQNTEKKCQLTPYY